jgi:hypothetical protein
VDQNYVREVMVEEKAECRAVSRSGAFDQGHRVVRVLLHEGYSTR